MWGSGMYHLNHAPGIVMMMLMSKMTIETMEDEIKDWQIWEEGSDGSKVGRQELRMYQ